MRRLPAASAALCALALAGCDRSAEDVVRAAARATAAGRAQALRPLLHPDYADTLGDGADLIRDLEAWFRTHPPKSWEAVATVNEPADASDRRIRAELRIEASWGGEPAFFSSGPIRVTLERWDGYELRSGWMTDLRDVGRLVEAWETARRAPMPGTLRPLLHPRYDDDFVDAGEVARRWIRHGPTPARPTLARLELRDDLAHLDLHEVIEERTPPQPVVHRLTLRPVAGRWRIAAGIRFGPRDASGRDLAPDDELR